jgi:hypothetical protein
LGLPLGGIFPPNHARQEPLLASVDVVPEMYPCPLSHAYELAALAICVWQPLHCPGATDRYFV